MGVVSKMFQTPVFLKTMRGTARSRKLEPYVKFLFLVVSLCFVKR